MLSTILQGNQMSTPIQQIAKDLFVLGFDAYPFEKLIEVLSTADEGYFNDSDSFFSDTQYDALKRYAQASNPAHSYFLGVGSSVRGGKVKLPYSMGSLDQVYEGDFVRWVKKHKIENEELTISHKLDGYSALVVYDGNGKIQIAYSRGDGTEGADITRHFRKIHNVPQTIKLGNGLAGKPFVVRGEVIFSLKGFQKIKGQITRRDNRQYKNARNMVSGLMNSSENEDIFYNTVDFVVYQNVDSKWDKHQQLANAKALGFKIVLSTSKKAKDLDDNKLTALLDAARKMSEYEIDGLVVEVNDATARQRINPSRDTINPAYAVKYKVADVSNLAIATVKEVEWNVSRHGYLKPRVCINPVELVGVTVQHATGFNAKFINDNKIGPGAKIKITRSGDVIPFILEVVQPAKEAQMPDADYTWTSTGVDAVIKNAKNNATVKFEQLNSFFEKIEAPHLREGNLQLMFDAGFTTPEDVILMTEGEICGLIGNANGKKIFKGIRDSLTDIPMYVLMGAHIAFDRGIGVRKFKMLWEEFEGDMTKCSDVFAILSVRGFEHKTATKIANGYSTFMEFYMKVKKLTKVAPYKAKKQGSMTGQVCVMTGFRDSELEQQVIDLGGTWGSGVSKNTTILIAKDPNENSGKLKKARDLGVKIVGLDKFKAML